MIPLCAGFGFSHWSTRRMVKWDQRKSVRKETRCVGSGAGRYERLRDSPRRVA